MSNATPKDINESIDDYEKKIKSAQGYGKLKGEDLMRELKLIETMRGWAGDKDQVKSHRDAFVAKQSEALRIYFRSLPNNYEAYKREVDSWSTRFRLEEKIVQSLMKEDPSHTIVKVEAKGLDPKFLLGSLYKAIEKAFVDFGKSAEILAKFPWAPSCHDFYEFLAKVTGDSRENLRKADTATLAKIAAEQDPIVKAKFSAYGDGSAPIRTIFSNMKTVFTPSKPELRSGYDNQMLYESLRPTVFTAIQALPEEAKKDDRFAQKLIKQIKEVFDDDELALAIYNKEANLLQDPYEPTKVIVTMRCANCNSVTNFSTHEEAKHGKCGVCGSPFYIHCPSCGELIPASANSCSKCGFSVGEFLKVESYYASAKSALAKGDFSEAHLYLQQAEAGDPKHAKLNKFADFADVSKKIQVGYEQYSKYFAGLSSLIAGKSFYKAKEEAEKVKRQYPNLDISSHLKKITEALDKAKSMMPASSDYSEAAAVRCYEILDAVTDYLPAKEHLLKVNLTPVTNLAVVALQGSSFGVSVSFAPSKHTRVTYCIVRNDKAAPKSYSDGILLAKDTTNTVLEDTKIEPGKAYYYGVFVCREGVFSPGAVARFAYFAEPTKVEAVPQGPKVTVGFMLPTNAVGVRIYRKENAIPSSNTDPAATCVAQNVRMAHEDKSVMLDHQYGYLVQAIYMENNLPVYSKGVGVLVRVERDPSDLLDVKIEKVGAAIQVKYRAADPTSPNSVRLYSIKPGLVEKRMHTLIPYSELATFIQGEKLLGSGKAKDGQFSFTIAGDFAYSVALVSLTDAKAIICGLGNVSSIPTLEVDKKRTQIKDGAKAYVRLKDVPANCFGIHYIALDVSHPKNEITPVDMSSHQTSFVPGQNYRREGLLDVRGRCIQAGQFKLLLLGEFIINGQHVYSTTTVTKISALGQRTIGYKLVWAKHGLFKKTYSATLCIDCKGPLPELVFMGKDGGTPISPSDYEAQEIIRFPSSDSAVKQVGDQYQYPIPAEYISPTMNYRLFLAAPDDDLKVSPTDFGSLAQPK